MAHYLLLFNYFFFPFKSQAGKNIFFTSDLSEALENTKIIFIAVNTPTKTYGTGANKSLDLKNIEESIRKISNFFGQIELKEDLIIVEKSTVPVTTSKYLKQIFQENQVIFKKNREKIRILSNPEFLAEDKSLLKLKIFFHKVCYPRFDQSR